MEEQIQEQSSSNQLQEPIPIGDWVITLLISFIPFIGFIMLFVWGFSAGTNPNKANWAKATLIWTAIGLFFMFLFWGMISAVIFSNMDSFNV